MASELLVASVVGGASLLPVGLALGGAILMIGFVPHSLLVPLTRSLRIPPCTCSNAEPLPLPVPLPCFWLKFLVGCGEVCDLTNNNLVPLPPVVLGQLFVAGLLAVLVMLVVLGEVVVMVVVALRVKLSLLLFFLRSYPPLLLISLNDN